MTTMIANAMWYREPDKAAEETAAARPLVLGPITISINTIIIAIFGSLTVVPINVIIVQLFRKTKPRHYVEMSEKLSRQSKSMGNKQMRDILFSRSKSATKRAYKRKGMPSDLAIEDIDVDDDEQQRHKRDDVDGSTELRTESQEPVKPKVKFWRQKYPLPWQCIYIGWTLAILSTTASAFFVLLYSLQWGKAKSEIWLSSLVISFCQSVIIVQPIKVNITHYVKYIDV